MKKSETLTIHMYLVTLAKSGSILRKRGRGDVIMRFEALRPSETHNILEGYLRKGLYYQFSTWALLNLINRVIDFMEISNVSCKILQSIWFFLLNNFLL